MKFDLAIFRMIFFLQNLASWFFLFSWGMLLIKSLEFMKEPFGVYIAVTAWGFFYITKWMAELADDTLNDIKDILKRGKK